jgi:hypothetical protein
MTNCANIGLNVQEKYDVLHKTK